MKKTYLLLSAFLVLGSFALNLNAQTYVIPPVTYPTTDDDIRLVVFAGISNTTTCGVIAPGPGSIAGAYSNFTGSAGVPNLAGSLPNTSALAIMGNSYSVQVGLGMCGTTNYSGIIGVFIDYNQNGSFLDTGELIWTSTYGPGMLQATAPGYAVYASPNFIIPFTATPGLTRMRVWESETTAMSGPNGSILWGETEDYIVNIVPPTPCSTTPGANSVVVTTAAICPNASTPLSLSTTYTVGNIGYQWSYSNVSALGPFTVIPTASITAALASPNLSVTSWFQLSTWCGNGGSTLTTAAAQVSVSPVITSIIPYYEGFEGITPAIANQLPNCSWASTGGNAQTNTTSNTNSRIPRTGNSFASVYGYNLAGTNYYYTNGIYMNAGVTYSASVFWMTEYYGYTNFSEISIKYGPAQSPTGLINIATQSVAVSPVYKELANTFQVATSGLYYVAIKVVSTINSYAYYLSWDDLSITIPCQLNPINMVVSATSSVICLGQSVNLSVTGANTYTWNTGANTGTISDSPTSNTSYMVTGTSTLTGCTSVVTKNIQVKPTPIVSIVPSATAVCEGSSVNLVALGATSYTWNNGTNSAFISVSPTANFLYSVMGSYANSACTGSTTQMINVNLSPNITAINSPASSCIGQPVTLTGGIVGGGTATFQWVATTAYIQGSPVTVMPTANTTYSVTGTDENGCSKTITINQLVGACTSISEHSGSINGLNVYPNPNNGEFTIEVINGLSKTVEIADVTGRVLSSQTATSDKMNLNINNFANGVYYVKVKTNDAVEVLKVIKQ